MAYTCRTGQCRGYARRASRALPDSIYRLPASGIQIRYTDKAHNCYQYGCHRDWSACGRQEFSPQTVVGRTYSSRCRAKVQREFAITKRFLARPLARSTPALPYLWDQRGGGARVFDGAYPPNRHPPFPATRTIISVMSSLAFGAGKWFHADAVGGPARPAASNP